MSALGRQHMSAPGRQHMSLVKSTADLCVNLCIILRCRVRKTNCPLSVMTRVLPLDDDEAVV